MSIDLRSTRGVGGSWVRCFGAHEDAGFSVYINDVSAHVTLTAHDLKFEVDRQDIPTAWAEPIDVVQLRAELIAAIVRRMTTEVAEELFQEMHSQRQSAFRAGEQTAKIAIREALGL